MGGWKLAATAVLMLAVDAGAVSGWRAHVPEKDRGRVNPLPQTGENAAAGEQLYRRNCVVCHGRTGEGTGRRPNLRSEQVRATSDGELMWILSNGTLLHGMPSWSKLPEQQRWQIIEYLRTLPMDQAAVKR
jgi:mono/diheme cytochrome c family protein